MSNQHSNDIHIYKLSDVMSYIMTRYIQTYEDFVYKNSDGKYVFTKMMSDRNIQITFNMFLREFVYNDQFKFGNRNTLIVAGSYPFMNWRRTHFDDIKDNNKNVIIKQLFLNYIITDRSIRVDEVHLCNNINAWFVEKMINPQGLADTLDMKLNAVSFVFNKNLSELDFINIVKVVYSFYLNFVNKYSESSLFVLPSI